MWEILTGEKPYKDHPHDIHLAFKIIDGLRPTIPEGTPDDYTSLMQKCWHENPAEWPDTCVIKYLIMKLNKSMNLTNLIKKRELGSASASSIHPEACYISRHLPFDELR